MTVHGELAMAASGEKSMAVVTPPRRRPLGGDLIVGTSSSALATVAERVTRYTLLVPLPGLRTMDALNRALTKVFGQFPDHLVRSLTCEQGKEIAGHEALAAATGLSVYLCEPNSPWQRGTNENTGGLLRQYPRGMGRRALHPPSPPPAVGGRPLYLRMRGQHGGGSGQNHPPLSAAASPSGWVPQRLS